MKGDDVGLFPCQLPQRAIAKGNVAMRGSVEAVSTDAMPSIEVIRNGVQVRLLWNRMVKRSVEYGHLGNVLAEELSRRHDALDVVRIVKGRKINAVFNSLQDLVVDKGRLREQLAAVHNAMPNRLNVTRTLDLGDSRFVGGNVADQVVQRRRNVAQRSRELLSRFGALLESDYRLPTDAFHLAAADALIFLLLDPIQIGGN